MEIFNGLFDTSSVSVISVSDFLLCLVCALALGIMLSASYMFKNRYTKSFITTLALLPAVVCVVIMMVNGNIGTGVAVAGAFSLVRFRSLPGSGKEIVMLFLAMAAGLIAGMGYVGYAFLFTVILSVMNMLCSIVNLNVHSNNNMYKTIRITIPESLDYSGVFDDLFKKYTDNYVLNEVKTVNMGSLFKLTYDIVLKKNINEKEFIDELRIRNGNLEISMSTSSNITTEL